MSPPRTKQNKTKNPNMQIFVISQNSAGIYFKQRLDKNYSLSQINHKNALLCKDRLPSLNKVMYFEPQSGMIYVTDTFCKKTGG